MKPEIKAMLPDGPLVRKHSDSGDNFIWYCDFKNWLEKLTEGAREMFATEDVDDGLNCKQMAYATHRYLVIPLGEIKKQTPLEYAVDAMKRARREISQSMADAILDEALSKIEAAK